MKVLRACPLSLREANALIEEWHPHHKATRGQKFAIGCVSAGELVGAAITGRPVARNVDYRIVAEVTRLVTNGTKNACSFLYGASARAAAAMGYQKIQTYILEDEDDGTSLKAAGWEFEEWTIAAGDGSISRWGQRWGRLLLA